MCWANFPQTQVLLLHVDLVPSSPPRPPPDTCVRDLLSHSTVRSTRECIARGLQVAASATSFKKDVKGHTSKSPRRSLTSPGLQKYDFNRVTS